MERKYHNDKNSNKVGIIRSLELFLRKIKTTTFAIMFIVISLICIICCGLATSVAVSVYSFLDSLIVNSQLSNYRSILIGINIFFSFFCYGISLVFISPAFNYILQLKRLVKPFKGGTYSFETIPWYLHNALIYIVRYSFLDFITPSPLNVFFYKMMGMKIGKGAVINTTNISDACLIELGDFVIIGGSAHLLTHYSQNGALIVSTLKIGSYSTIGLKATVFGNVIIGDRCLIKPHSVVLPKTTLGNDQSI